MHNAPAVTYPVGRSPFAGMLLLVVCLLGAGALALWMARSRTSIVVSAFAAGCWLVATGAAFLGWWRSSSGWLSWNGEHWLWASAGDRSAPALHSPALADVQAGELAASLDAQAVLLVRWRAPGTVRWLWLERSRAPARWDDLRRAVYSRARVDALPGLAPPPANS